MNFRFCHLFLGTITLIAINHSNYASGQKIHFNTDGNPYIKFIHGGILSGKIETSREGKPYSAFVGIPYAVVTRRFDAPQPLQRKTWTGTKEAIHPGYICPQPKRTLNLGNGLTENENCLNLNVYVPHTKDSSPLPVMVWVHGGGFMAGNALFYQPAFFMDTSDVIIVTINYRLGVFGFLSTADNAVSANNGLKDQVMALKWVQENIEAWGGDPGKVTLFGESAGGAAVNYLMLSPMAKGLFHRAISQSGSSLGLWAYQPKPRENAKALATHVGCTDLDSSKDIVNCLRKLSTEELSAAQISYKTGWPKNEHIYFFAPTREAEGTTKDPFLTIRPEDAMMNDDAYVADVPWIVGVTKDEGCVFFSAIVLNSQELTNELNDNWNALAPDTLFYGRYIPANQQNAVSEKIRSFYFGTSSISTETSANLTNLFSDNFISYTVYRAALATALKSNRKSPVYFYQYAYSGPASLIGLSYKLNSGEAKKIGHGDELQHQFDLGFNKDFKEVDDLEFSKNFNKLWTNFAVSGIPSHPSWGEKWEPLSSRRGNLKWYKIDANPRNEEIDSKYIKRMQFWDGIWKDYITPKKSPVRNQKTEL